MFFFLFKMQLTTTSFEPVRVFLVFFLCFVLFSKWTEPMDILAYIYIKKRSVSTVISGSMMKSMSTVPQTVRNCGSSLSWVVWIFFSFSNSSFSSSSSVVVLQQQEKEREREREREIGAVKVGFTDEKPEENGEI